MAIGVKRALIVVLALGSLGALLFVRPLPQPPGYHRFADQRTIFGIPHFMNVASNLPFLVAGVLGVSNALRGKAVFYPAPEARGLWILLGLSIALTAFGSAYYHWEPTDATLFWDRLPMAMGFSSLLGLLILERVDRNSGCRLAIPLVFAGVGSLLYWRSSGDLRFYVLLQGWAIVLPPLILLLFPAPCTESRWLWTGFGLYGLAKLFEHLDAPIYDLIRLASGHSLKHLAAAAGSWYLFLHLVRRRNP